MADRKAIQLQDGLGNLYDIKDAEARGEIDTLKSAINSIPDIRDSSATGVDLDLTDGQGNVIVRFKDGHIQTKEFDSASLASAFSAKQDVLTFDDTPTENSTNPVKSGGVYSEVQRIEGIIGESTAPVLLSCSENDFNIVRESYCDPSNGVIHNEPAYSSYDRSDYIPVSPGDVIRVTWGRHYTYFDTDKEYVSGGDISALSGYTGSQEENFVTIPSGVAFVIINYYALYNSYGITLESKADPEIVILGDSIYGIGPYPFNPCYYAAQNIKRNVADCAFGGTTAFARSNSDYGKYSFVNIADCIAAGDFSSMTDFSGMPSIFKQHRTTLAAVDWTKVKVICVAHCTNDWDFGVTYDNDQNPKDTNTFLGALRYGMETIWDEYPQIQFILYGALYKTVTNETGKDSDEAKNINNKTLREFIDGMKSVAEEYHQNYFDHYNIGFNKYTAPIVFRPDGVHLSYDVGAKMLGVRTAKEIGMVLWGV